MEVVPENENEIKFSESFYLPQHFVIKVDSTTTKLQVVFNASAKTALNSSLKSNLMVGPTFRVTYLTFVFDFAFKSLCLVPTYQKCIAKLQFINLTVTFIAIYGVKTTQNQFSNFRKTRATYSVTSSSFHSFRSLLKLANTAPEKVRQVIEHDMYVDDLLTGCSNLEEAKNLQDQLIKTLQTGGFPLRKWTSNSPKLIKR